MTQTSTPAVEKVWTLIQITDTHLMDQPELTFANMNPEQSFLDVVKDIKQRFPQIDAVIHTGDLAQVAAESTYQRYLQFMQDWQVPHYQIPGNHDDNLAIFPFHNNKNEAHAIHFGSWTLILLNSAVKGRVDGWVEQKQLEQLEQLLLEHQQQHVIVACHHHPFAMQSHWIDQHRLKNSEALKDVIARHSNVKMVLFGHVHQDSENEWQGVRYLSTPSTSVQFKPLSENFALDQAQPGYRVLLLKENGEYETYINRVRLTQPKINTEISGY
ncbi:3',5'-cyclic-AMP phosphodiesterase [Acinetobacter thermotolerans]|uniref:3',5'-cyclic-AMP phosphodiesterase n=1 Tax=Acinetobacter thermotolerans TaxID=3151487 RepID=UPI00325A818F